MACLYFFLLLISPIFSAACYTSVFSFGDSLIDTGNYLHIDDSAPTGRLPYGQTFFHRGTGRSCDGRVVLDFIAEALGIPFLSPYLAFSDAQQLRHGANFAVGGATALPADFFKERKIDGVTPNVSFGDQIEWFSGLLPSLCSSPSDEAKTTGIPRKAEKRESTRSSLSFEFLSSTRIQLWCMYIACRHFLRESLFLVGEIGGNDYAVPFSNGWKLEEIRTLVPQVVGIVTSAVDALIKHGATTLVVPGVLPLGCFAAILTSGESSNKEDYEATTGCLKNWNEMLKYHNRLLKMELRRLREMHPHATVIYSDYYNAAWQAFASPQRFGALAFHPLLSLRLARVRNPMLLGFDSWGLKREVCQHAVEVEAITITTPLLHVVHLPPECAEIRQCIGTGMVVTRPKVDRD
ncbi:hypothetical protein ACLOJK_009384 [Asimina triloba]